MSEGELKKQIGYNAFGIHHYRDVVENRLNGQVNWKLIIEVLDEAKKELLSFLHEYVSSGKKLDENWLLIQYDEWTIKWFGEIPYEKWLDEAEQ